MSAPRLVVSAPGKLVIAGEYAVLCAGHPAVVAAVDRRVVARLEGTGPLTVAGLERGPDAVIIEDKRVSIPDDDGAFELVRWVLQTALDRGLPPLEGTLSIDSSSMAWSAAGATEKLGLGSSAGVAVTVSRLCLEGHDPSHERVLDLAFAAHHAFSGGKGSGIDVAAAVYGGLILFRRGEWSNVHGYPIADDDEIIVEPLCPLPDALEPVVVYTGHSQSTREFVAAVHRFRDRDAEAHAELVGNISAVTQHLPLYLETGASEGVLEVIEWARKLMARLGEAAGIDIVSPEHQAIADLAMRFGGQAKPSGAGGGDVAIALIPKERADSFRSACDDAGFPVVDLTLGDAGVRVD